MDSDVLNPFATITIGFQGLAVYCHNPTFDDGSGRKGRWEIAIPRFIDHELIMSIPGLGVITIDRRVKKIEIKDRVGVPTKPKHELGFFDRKDKAKSDSKDYRWLTNITDNGEIPHGTVTIKKKKDLAVTMLYVYDAVFYTKTIEDFSLVLGTHNATCPVDQGVPKPLPEAQAGKALDAITDPYGFSAVAVGIDIQSPNGGVVDLIFDNGARTSFPQADGLHSIFMSNLEPADAKPQEGGRVTTVGARYGRGDFFRYYELFEVTGSDRFHLWEKFPLDLAGPLPAIEGDCNGTRVDFTDLNDLASD